jgi:hypothetical protein
MKAAERYNDQRASEQRESVRTEFSCMTIRTTVAVLGLLFTFVSCFGQNQSNKSELSIKDLDREFEAAFLKGDSAALDRLVADDYLGIDARGQLSNKSDMMTLARVRSSPRSGVSVGPERTVAHLTIRLHGNSAVVAGRTTICYQFMEYQTVPGTPPSQNPAAVDQERFIRSYAKVGTRWQLIAWQTTSIAKQ